MSRLNLIDYILKTEDNEATTMDDMNTTLDYSSDFMRSDFFDSVMSLEEDNGGGSVLENYNKVECVPPPSSETSSHFDEVQSNNSLSLDSDKWNEIFETSTPTINLPEDTFFPFVEEPRTVLKNDRPIQKQVQNKIILDKVKGKKLYVTKINPNFKKNYTSKQVLRVQSLTGNGQPLLLPISDVKRIKIVNASDIKTEGLNIKKQHHVQFKKQKTETYSVSSSDCTEDDIDVSETSPYPALVLTAEEKRLLDKDGIQLPTHYPLTKNEERELKRIRRKIRNKISAQDSRKRKKEYVDGLEERVKRGSEENKFLLKRVKQLQKQNSRLMAQMSKLQSLLFNTSASKVTPSTCLMIVLFSALLVSLPNLHTSNEKELGDIQQMAARRALLFSQQATNEEDTLNMEEFLLFNKEDDLDNYIEEGADENETSTEKEAFTKFISEADKKFNNDPNCSELNSFDSFIELFSKFENKIKNVFGTLNSGYSANEKREYEGTVTKNGFMEPDVDDDLPKINKNGKNDYYEDGGTPPKRMKFSAIDSDMNEKHDFNENVVSATLNSAYKISESKKQ